MGKQRKKQMRPRIFCGLLCTVYLAVSLLGVWPGAWAEETVWGAPPPIQRIEEEWILDEKYRWQARFLPGKTKASAVNCDNVYREQFLTGPNGDWGGDSTAGVASLPEGDIAFGEGEAPGCYYRDVGDIELPDGSVKAMDMRLTITAAYGGESRYDMRTPRLTTTNPDYQPGSSLSHITYSWKNGMGRPCVSFLSDDIGLRIYGVEGVDVQVSYFDHKTGQPLAVSGHGNLSDIDGLQSITFPEDSGIDRVYLLKGSEDHLTIDGSTIQSADGALDIGDRSGDISYFFQNTDSVNLHFSYQKALEKMSASYRQALSAAGGDRERLAEIMKKNYYGSNGETLLEDYEGGEWITSHGVFLYESQVVGQFVTEPSEELAKKVGNPGCTWQEARAAKEEDPFWISDEGEFDYLVQYELSPASLETFQLQDTLEPGLLIEGEHQISITDKKGEEVTRLFDLSIENGRKITCTGKAEAIRESSFSQDQIYTFRFRVRRDREARLSFQEDNFTYLLPNRATLRLSYETTDGGAQEETYESDQVWVGGRITPRLQVEKKASRYEWQAGEEVSYTVKVTQKKQGAWAVNLEIADTSIPSSLKLTDDFSVDGEAPEEHFVIAREGENGWKCTGPLLQYDESVVIRFQCLATEEANGKEWENRVEATAENWVDEITGDLLPAAFAREEVWVNSPDLLVEKRASQYEWQVGQEVEYLVTVANDRDYTVAREVVIEDELPEGLILQGENPLAVSGLPKEAALPRDDGKTGMDKSRRVLVNLETEWEETRWKIAVDVFPAQTVLTVAFSCLAEGDPAGESPEEMKAPANGKEVWNSLRVNWKNGSPKREEENVYINTPWMSIDKAADHYEWKQGEEVAYQVTVENQAPGTIAREVKISDSALPQGLILADGVQGITVEGLPETFQNPVKAEEAAELSEKKEGFQKTEEAPVEYETEVTETGWEVRINHLPAGYPVTIAFSCLAGEDANGREAVNRAQVQAVNGVGRTDDAKVYVNTAVLSVEKTVKNPYGEEKQDGRLEQEFRVGEVVEYQVQVTNRQPGSIARKLVVEDVNLPEYLTLEDPKAIRVEGIPETVEEPWEGPQDPENQEDPQDYGSLRPKEVVWEMAEKDGGWRLMVSDLPYDCPVTVTYRCTLGEAANGKEILNIARAFSDNGAPAEASQKIWVNTPKLSIEKKADKDRYLIGDTLTYTISVRQEAAGCVARNLVLEDLVKTPGVKLQKSTVVLTGEEGEKLPEEPAVQENAFVISTARNLVKEENYLLWDPREGQEIPQEAWNPLGLKKERRLGAEYAAEIVDRELAGQEIQNVARVTSQEQYPAETEESLIPEAPKLRVTKESDRPLYHLGEVGYYHILVEQIRENVTAEEIQIADHFQGTGMELQRDTLKAALNERLLEDVTVTWNDQGFSLETKEALQEGDRLDIYYQVIFSDPSLAGASLENTAAAWGKNTAREESRAVVEVEEIQPRLAIEKTSDREAYEPGETGYYQVTVTQTEAGAVARNVILEDRLVYEKAEFQPETLRIVNTHGNPLSNCEVQPMTEKGAEVSGFTVFTGVDLDYQESLTLEYQVEFLEDIAPGEVPNTASATGENVRERISEAPDPVSVGEGLTARKTAAAPSGSRVKVGEIISYYIEVSNESASDRENVLVKDRIPSYTKLAGSKEGDSPMQGRQQILEGEPFVTFLIPVLEAGETVNLTFRVEVMEIPRGEKILNAAQVRTTLAEGERVTKETWMNGDFRYTNETVHYGDTLWVSAEHKVEVGKDEEQVGTYAGTAHPLEAPGGIKGPEISKAPPYEEAGGASLAKGGVNTGDESPVEFLLLIMVGSLVIMVGSLAAAGLGLYGRRRGKKEK